MKGLNIIFILVLLSGIVKAQDKIVISYDDNGNRIKRERICPSCRPPRPGDQPNENNRPGSLAEQIGTEQFSVYPNPSDDKFNIALDAKLLKGKCSFILTDQLGRELLRRNITTPLTTLGTGELTNGTYYIIIISDEKKRTVKLVKESGY